MANLLRDPKQIQLRAHPLFRPPMAVAGRVGDPGPGLRTPFGGLGTEADRMALCVSIHWWGDAVRQVHVGYGY